MAAERGRQPPGTYEEAGARLEEVERGRKVAEKAKERVSAGEDFVQVAKEVSQGPTASTGGERGRQRVITTLFGDRRLGADKGDIRRLIRGGVETNTQGEVVVGVRALQRLLDADVAVLVKLAHLYSDPMK